MKRLVFATFVCLALPAAPALAQKGPPPPPPSPIYDNGGYPDLLIDTARLTASLVTQTVTFSSTSCELVEGSIGAAGARRLLRFDVAIPNLGNGDLVVGSPTDPNNPYYPIFQFSPCHGHYHIQGFTNYELLSLDRTTVVAFGHKQAFCLEDVTRFAGKGASHGYTCSYQGITSGWADVYSRYLSGQWVDITGVPAGDYVLHVEINAAGTFPENQNRYPNVFEVTVHISSSTK
jgi:hypothetical protein